MPESPRPGPRSTALWRAAGLFAVAYLVFLPLWLLVNKPYGYLVTGAAARLAAYVKSVDILNTFDEGEKWTVHFLKRGTQADLEIEYGLPTSRYAFNTPLTLAIMVPFFPYLRKKSAYLEALSILVGAHLLTAFFMVGNELTAEMVFRHFEARGPTNVVWNFAGAFFDNFVIRFEPFLIGTYLYFRAVARGDDQGLSSPPISRPKKTPARSSRGT